MAQPDPDFPPELRSFIQDIVPSVDAAELLVLLAHDPGRQYSVREAVDAMRPTAVTEPAARRYLLHFLARGLVAAPKEDTYHYEPASPERDTMVRALARVYNERPVTLVRLIYAPRDEKIRSFADAFRIKK